MLSRRVRGESRRSFAGWPEGGFARASGLRFALTLRGGWVDLGEEGARLRAHRAATDNEFASVNAEIYRM